MVARLVKLLKMSFESWDEARKHDTRALQVAQFNKWVHERRYIQELWQVLVQFLPHDLRQLISTYVVCPPYFSTGCESIVVRCDVIPERLGACECVDQDQMTTIVRICGAHHFGRFGFRCMNSFNELGGAVTFYLHNLPIEVGWFVGLMNRQSCMIVDQDGRLVIKTADSVKGLDKSLCEELFAEKWPIWNAKIHKTITIRAVDENRALRFNLDSDIEFSISVGSSFVNESFPAFYYQHKFIQGIYNATHFITVTTPKQH